MRFPKLSDYRSHTKAAEIIRLYLPELAGRYHRHIEPAYAAALLVWLRDTTQDFDGLIISELFRGAVVFA